MIKDIIQLSKTIAELKQKSIGIEPSTLTADQLVDQAITDGGKICGGYACARYHGKKASDIDIYFKDHDDYTRYYAYTQNHDKIDICLYNVCPTEYHDISPSMIILNRDSYEITEPAKNTYETRIITINQHNLINPFKTLERVIKYCNKYEMKCNKADMICLCTMLREDWTKHHQILSGS